MHHKLYHKLSLIGFLKLEGNLKVLAVQKSFGSIMEVEWVLAQEKKYENKCKHDGVVTSCRFVCSKQGLRGKDKRDHLTKNARAETRTDCKVHMTIKFNRASLTYKVNDLVVEHNHILQTPETAHLLPSQRSISEVQAIEIELADGSGINPRVAHEFASRYVGGRSNLGYTCCDHKNYLRTKRQKKMKYGEAGSILHYFQSKVAENPSFYYAVQLDSEEQITNIFWADAKMLIDYAHFGDVMTFDTTFGTNRESRPFGVFVGFNHFRETVIFGASLMYDETCESFTWLFEAFLSCHNQKHPRTIYTDQDVAMGKAIAHTFPDTWHGLCVFHLSQNALKHLNRYQVDGSNTFADGSNILADFMACMYEIDDEAEFEVAFSSMRSKVHVQTWLDSIYKVKEKWAECYIRNVFTLGMRSTQLSEALNRQLKDYLHANLNVLRFFEYFESAVQAKRDKEISSEYDSRDKLPKIKVKTPMLVQASRLYTPPLFEAFQIVYERSLSATACLLDDKLSYVVSIRSFDDPTIIEEEHMVVERSGQLSCSCQLFDRSGLPCSHIIKILESMDVKQLPDHYVLKRWTREARHGIVQDNVGRKVSEDPKLDATRRYKFLSHRFISLASHAAKSEETFELVNNALYQLQLQVDERVFRDAPNINSTNNDQTSQEEVNNEAMLQRAILKKKEVKSRSSKRKLSWVEKLFRKRR